MTYILLLTLTTGYIENPICKIQIGCYSNYADYIDYRYQQ